MRDTTLSELLLGILLTGTLTLLFTTHPFGATSGTWTVDDDGPADFRTIQQAIDTAARGDTIHVSSGIYSEHLYVWKPLTLTGENRSTTIIDGGGRGNVIDIQADYVTLSCFTVRNSSQADWDYAGIYLYHRRHCTIVNNRVELCASGLIVGYSHLNEIRGNAIANFTYGGIILFRSTLNTIAANYVTTNIAWPALGQLGIHLDFEANENIVTDNTVASSQFGIEVERSSRNQFTNNTVIDTEFGIVFYNWYTSPGTENKLQLNNLKDNHYHFSVSGYHLHHYIHEIDVSNLIDGRPIVYLVNQHNLIIDPSTFPTIGFLGLINCSYITVRNINITRNPSGILLAHTTHSTVINSFISTNIYGMRLANASYNTIAANTIVKSNCTLAFYDSSRNAIFHNNFIDNLQQTYDFASELSTVLPSSNTWDDGYPSGGNYWSDYEERYPDAAEKASSGIWDTPYVVDENNQDNYPLMEPWTPSPPIPTTIAELKTEIGEMESHGGINNQGVTRSFIAKLNVAQNLIAKGKAKKAKNILEDAFIPQVQSLAGIHITKEAADILIESAEYILSHLRDLLYASMSMVEAFCIMYSHIYLN